MDHEVKPLFRALCFPAIFIAIIWFVFLLQIISGTKGWYELGVYPRQVDGLSGILTSSLIHSNLGHIFGNSLSMLVLGWFLSYSYKDLRYMVFLTVWLLSGTFTWLIGREAWHIGASGLVYALAFFLFFSGVFRKYVPLMAVSLIVVFLYGSGMWSLSPIAELVDPNISWEGHLSGGISGLIVAFLFRKQGPQKQDPFEEEDDEDEDENGEWKEAAFQENQDTSFTS